MRKNKFFRNTIASIVVAIMCINFTSCKDDNDVIESKELIGWYTDLSSVAKQSDFDILNEAINNNEVLTYHYKTSTPRTTASRSLFIDSNGMFGDADPECGRLRFSIQFFINAIKIVDNTTLLFYVAYLYEDGRSKEDAVYKLYAGPIFGNMTYYGTPAYYTYSKVENKILVSNGDIYTIANGTLIKDGSSIQWVKYDQTRTY